MEGLLSMPVAKEQCAYRVCMTPPAKYLGPASPSRTNELVFSAMLICRAVVGRSGATERPSLHSTNRMEEGEPCIAV